MTFDELQEWLRKHEPKWLHEFEQILWDMPYLKSWYFVVAPYDKLQKVSQWCDRSSIEHQYGKLGSMWIHYIDWNPDIWDWDTVHPMNLQPQYPSRYMDLGRWYDLETGEYRRLFAFSNWYEALAAETVIS